MFCVPVDGNFSDKKIVKVVLFENYGIFLVKTTVAGTYVSILYTIMHTILY